ncbi:unnamed protein product [Hermetia illucens]|uniref:Uncharacterized protein n=1 Tax=Hermetia illucens TaxID=343691 RepID=A0A7R8YLX9_HERIL|nr:uncharacterized protein LOC119646534 [Hermetia illucens]CAD7076872.1 unnamed protein product [Hermetia illucens]
MLILFVTIAVLGFIETVDANPEAAACSQIPPHSLIFNCCHHQILLSGFGPGCIDLIVAHLQPTNLAPISLCLAECIFRRSGVLTSNEFVFDKAKENVQTIFNQTDTAMFIPILSNGLEKCSNIVKENMETPVEVYLPEDICEPIPAIIAQCTLVDSILKCPKGQWEDSAACNGVRDFFTNCKHPSFKF